MALYSFADLSFQCLFEPRVIEFEQKRAGMRFLTRAPDMAEEMVEQSADKLAERYVRSYSTTVLAPEAHLTSPWQTQAMMISTQHLFPVLVPAVPEQPPPITPSVSQTPAGDGQSLAVTPQPPASGV